MTTFEQNFKFAQYASHSALFLIMSANDKDYQHSNDHANRLAKHAQRVSGYYGERLVELANLAFEIVYNLQIVVSLSSDKNDKYNAQRRLTRRLVKFSNLHDTLQEQLYSIRLMQD